MRRIIAWGVTIAVIVGLIGYRIYHLQPENQLTKRPEITITVFIHGSLFTGLSLLNPQLVWHDQLSADSTYVALVDRIRKHPLIRQDQILLDEGLQEIPRTMIDAALGRTMAERDAKNAAYGITAVYDVCMNLSAKSPCDKRYFAFGHLGLLSQRYRKEAAKQLYNSLCFLINDMRDRYETVRLIIVAHSHGGNIALNLAHHEDEQEQGLGVDALVMYGTPIQVETAAYASHSIFRRVLNCYSDGDSVQSMDVMSTKEHKSYASLFDERLGIKHRDDAQLHDVRLLVNGVSGHVDHANMWMIGRSDCICLLIDPLPYMIFTPFILDALEKITVGKKIESNLIYGSQQLCLECASSENPALRIVSSSIRGLLIRARDCVMSSWRPDDTNRSPVFNYKDGKVVYDAITHLRTPQRTNSAA